MATTKEQLKEIALGIEKSHFAVTNTYDTQSYFQKLVDQAIEKVDLEKHTTTYETAYIIVAAVLDRISSALKKGYGLDMERNKRCERKAKALAKKISLHV